MAEGLKKHGITSATLENLMFSAGVYYKNLKWASNAWTGTPLGATSGGGKLNIEPEYVDAELDGATVAVKGAKQKLGEAGSMEINMTEFAEGLITEALHLEKDSSKTVTGFNVYKTKAALTDDDYLENIAFVGNLVDGRFVIVVMENSICTSALELEPKNKTQATFALTYECTADVSQDDLTVLPIWVYFPQVAAV